MWEIVEFDCECGCTVEAEMSQEYCDTIYTNPHVVRFCDEHIMRTPECVCIVNHEPEVEWEE